jgi:hypothetical protein
LNPRLFTALPQDLATLTAEGLAAAITEREEIARRIGAGDPDLVPAEQFSAQDILDELEAGTEQLETLRAEQAGRADAEARFEAAVAERLAAAGVTPLSATDEETVDDSDDAASDADADAVADAADADPVDADAGDADAVDDAVTAAAAVPATLRRRIPNPTRDREPVVVDTTPGRPGLVAAADFHGSHPAGTPIDRMGFAEMAIEAARRVAPSASRPRVEVVLASATWDAPEERQLRSSDPEGNADKIRAVVPDGMEADALVASGGLCAPLTPIYDLPQIATEARPLRDNLPAFQAARGGITWATPPSIADVSTAVGLITAEEDGEGGTFATKTCQVLDCDPFNEAEIAAIYHCLEWGNIGARAWPERVAQFTDVVMAAWSRLAETNLLNLMKAGSTQVTAAQATYGYGALSNFTSQVLAAAAGYRSRFRMPAESRFRVVAPLWLRDMILSDVANSQYYAFELTPAGLDAYLSARLIDVIWTLDGENGGSQVFGAQNAGALLGFPTHVKWFLFPEGTWIWVTMGTLELGIVRDSVLNAQNDFQVFGEGFETIAQVGYQSLEITSILCPSGSAGAATTAISCS